MTENERVTTLHAHVNTKSVDCDGPFLTEYVMTPTCRDAAHLDEVPPSDRDEFVQRLEARFKNRVLAAVVSLAPECGAGRLDVRSFDDGTTRLEWSEITEEGYRAVEALTCTDESCDTGHTSQVDVFAEMAGY